MSRILFHNIGLRPKCLSERRPGSGRCVLALSLVLILLLLSACGVPRSADPGEAAQSTAEKTGASEGSNATGESNASEGSGLPETSDPASERSASEAPGTESETTEGTDQMFYAHVNGSVLPILAAKNSSAEAFMALLKSGDVTIDMHDYGNFEKVGPLGTTLPRNDEQITTAPGDVILYQGNQVTIYYDVNSWSFTRLGKVQGLSQEELKAILGKGNASVTFSLKGGAPASQTFDFRSRPCV